MTFIFFISYLNEKDIAEEEMLVSVAKIAETEDDEQESEGDSQSEE